MFPKTCTGGLQLRANNQCENAGGTRPSARPDTAAKLAYRTSRTERLQHLHGVHKQCTLKTIPGSTAAVGAVSIPRTGAQRLSWMRLFLSIEDQHKRGNSGNVL